MRNLCVNYKMLHVSEMTVRLIHGLSRNSLNTFPCELSAWLTWALLNIVSHGPRHCGDVDVGHLGAQGDLPEVSGAAAVAKKKKKSIRIYVIGVIQRYKTSHTV